MVTQTLNEKFMTKNSRLLIRLIFLVQLKVQKRIHVHAEVSLYKKKENISFNSFS